MGIETEHVNAKETMLCEFNVEIEKYEAIRVNVLNRGQLRLRMGLFEVVCSGVNSLMVNHCQELKNLITHGVAKQLIDKANKLVSEYENGSKILLHKPINANELNALVVFINSFDATQLCEWQDVSDEIGKELKFLFDCDHSLSHDLLRSVGRVSDWNKKIIVHKKSADESSVIQRQVIEKDVIVKSKQLEQTIKKMNSDVDSLQILSEIRDHARIDQMKLDIVAVEERRTYLRNQQNLLAIDESEFAIERIKSALEKL